MPHNIPVMPNNRGKAGSHLSSQTIDIIEVTPLPTFELDLTYADGSQRRLDMKPLLRMKPWNKVAAPSVFNQVKVAYGTVVWPGEIDVAPETLMLDSVLLAHV